MRRRSWPRIVLLLALLAPGSTAGAQITAAPTGTASLDLEQWEDDIRAFEAEDARNPPPTGGILFVGSSSIRLWKSLAADFPGLPVINRGFGGSQIREVTAFVPRIVLPYRPRLIVVYCGSNDITSGQRDVAGVFADYRAFVQAVHASLPHTRLLYISNAPNPARWHLRGAFRDLNARIEAYTRTDGRLGFIDVWPHMLGPNGRPRPELFVEDRLHMNEKGYAIWRRVVGSTMKMEK